MNKVETFIENGWSKCLKHNTKDEGTLIGLLQVSDMLGHGGLGDMQLQGGRGKAPVPAHTEKGFYAKVQHHRSPLSLLSDRILPFSII